MIQARRNSNIYTLIKCINCVLSELQNNYFNQAVNNFVSMKNNKTS